ncbi:hypothetical protein D3P08_12340 [Paenibacillus nanensis]|uniref:RDD domain-containing protein n=1 Tax=Paenibacillus nanensis TaxID=393251 RepID=A0A3A1UYL7_9BACL|nr:hypothetical protein D3P08_12340 [Paenibacillus nanensis]
MQQRLVAILLDHVVGTLMFGILFFAVNMNSFIHPTDSNAMIPFESFNTVLGFGILYYLLKDLYKGRSIGKRIMGLVVTDENNNEAIPGAIRLITRNITVLIWPIELITLILMRRRIGDLIAKTNVNAVVYSK